MVVAGLAAAALVHLGGSASVRADSTVEVPVQAFAYQPTTISVPVGTTVVWTNHDPVDHTVTDVDGAYDSGLFGESGTFSMTFTTPGTYTYYCIPHPMMIGTIEVTG